ncbi:MAG: alpha/beta hydrolase [Woeseiaceae bacterium]
MKDPGHGKTFTSADGLELFYRDFGPEDEGTPVICLPGLTRNSRDFLEIAEYIGERRRVLLPDLRGRGNSAYDPEWRNYHPATYINDTWTLLDSLGIERVIIIGTSLGGLCAMGMAAMQANRLAAVVINDIGPEINPAGIARIQSYVGQQEIPGTWEEAIEQTRANYGEFLPGLSHKDWEDMVWKGYREGDAGQPIPDYDPNIARALAEVGAQAGDPWMYFDALGPVRTTLLWGVLSDILTQDIVDKMAARKPDLDVVRVENRGHVPLLDEPECLAAVDTLLAEVT